MSLAQHHLDITKSIRRTVGGRQIFALCIDGNIRRAIMGDVRKRKNIVGGISMKADGVLIGSVK